MQKRAIWENIPTNGTSLEIYPLRTRSYLGNDTFGFFSVWEIIVLENIPLPLVVRWGHKWVKWSIKLCRLDQATHLLQSASVLSQNRFYSFPNKNRNFDSETIMRIRRK